MATGTTPYESHPDRMALTVGDVVGKGIAAAAIMGQLRSVLDAQLREGLSPVEALSRLSRLAGGVPGATGTTAAVALYDRPSRGGALYLRRPAAPASHLLTRPRYLEEARSVPLGIIDVELTEATCAVSPRRHHVALLGRLGGDGRRASMSAWSGCSTSPARWLASPWPASRRVNRPDGRRAHRGRRDVAGRRVRARPRSSPPPRS